MGVKPIIKEYLKIACQLVIDEFNEEYCQIDSKEELRKIANEQFSLLDMCNRIGGVFKVKVHYRGIILLLITTTLIYLYII